MQEERLIDKVKRSSGYVLARHVITTCVTIFITIYLYRTLSVDEIGIYNLIWGLLLYFNFLTNWGVQGSLQRFIPEYYTKKNHGRVMRTYHFSAVLNLVLAILFLGLSVVFFDHFAGLIKITEYKDYFIAFVVVAAIVFQKNILDIILNNTFLHLYQSIGQICYVVLKGVTIVIFLEAGFGVKGVFYAEFCGYMPVLLLLLLFYYLKYVRVERNRAVGDASIEGKRLLRYSFYNTLTIPGGIIYDYSTDYLVISHYLAFYDVGIYSFACRIARMIQRMFLPQTILDTVIRPAFYSHYTSREDKNLALQRMFNTLSRLNLFFMFPILVLLVVNGRPFILYVFGEKLVSAHLYLALTFAFLTASFSQLSSDLVIQSIEKVQYRFYGQIFAVYNIVMDIILILLGYGILGVTFATGTATLFYNVFLFYFGRKFTGIYFEWRSYGLLTLCALIMALVTLVASHVVKAMPGLIISSLIGTGAYLLAVLMLNPFTKEEKEQISNMLPEKVAGLLPK